MATAPSLHNTLQKLEEELECSLCLERLKDPRVFPQCQHSFCYECIERLSRGQSKIFCPECRAEVEVGIPPDLSLFKRNTRINNILECMKNDNLGRDSEHASEGNTSLVSETSLDIGSMVEVKGKNVKSRYGVIRWMGYIPNSDKKIAGLEMEEEISACTDGTFLGKRYFTCPNKRGFFVYLHNCLPDSRIPRNSIETSGNKQLTKPELKDNQLFVPQKSEEIVREGPEQSQDEATIAHNDKQKLKKSQAAIGISFNEQLKESKNYNNQTKLNLYADSDSNSPRSVPETTNEECTESKNKNQSKVKTSKDGQSKNKKSSEPRRDKFFCTFYILLKEICAKKQDRGSALKRLLKGEILIRKQSTVVDSAKGTLKLHPYVKPSYYCHCPIDNIKPLEDEEAMLLLSFKSSDERYKYFINNSLDVGMKMTIGSNVYVKVRSQSGETQELRGVIRYKGPLPGELGTMFGVELLEGKGRGPSDGYFKGRRYFKCDPNCGLFVALQKLRPNEETKDEKETGDENFLTKFKHKIVEGFSNLSNMVLPAEQANEENCSKLENKVTGHKLDDRVWVYIDDELCGGYLKYIGRVPSGEGGTLAGIHMDEPVGQGDGTYYGKQLLKCKQDHAYFTPIDNVISRQQFSELPVWMSCDAQRATGASDSNNSNCPRSVPETTHEEWTESKNKNQSKFKTTKDGQSKNIRFSEPQKDKFSCTFYILLKEMCAKKQGREYNYSGSGLKCLLKGEILIRNHLTVVDSAKGTLKLHPFGGQSYCCDCPIDSIKPLEDDEAMLLLSFKSNDERYKYFTSNPLDVGKKITIGTNVYVKVRSQSGGTQELRGVIRYKGPLPEEGTMFGVELLKGKGRGITDGLFKGQRYFKCDPNCGLFVALDKLRPYEEKKDEKETGDENLLTKFKHKIVEGFSNLSNMLLPAEQANEESCSKQEEDKATGHKLDDRVWVFIDDKPCEGCLKYIGRVPGGGGETFAGIYMDNPVGQGDGTYYGEQLLKCLKDHAYFTPIDHVISRQQFSELWKSGDAKRATGASDSSNSNSPRSVSQTTNEEWTESKKHQSKFTTSKDGQSKNKRSSEPRKDKFSNTFYILLKDMLANKQDRGYSYSSSNVKSILKGEILVRNFTTVVDNTNGTLRLHPYEKGTYYCDCPVENISPLEDEEAKLLLPFKTNRERYRYFTSSLLDVRKKMTVGGNVYVKVRSPSGGTQEVRGVIRYKGPLQGELGTTFGVELLEERGRGTTDGLFFAERYFKCDPNCGLFVALDELRPYEETKDQKETGDENLLTKVKQTIVKGFSNLSNFVLPAEQPNEENCSKQEDKTTGHKLEDRVWVYIDDKPCGGYLKYIGRVPGGGGGTLAGIYMDNRVGKGNGDYYDIQLFSCPMDHAIFTLIENVISKTQFQQMFSRS